MTAVASAPPTSAVDRIAGALGWTAGQVWTVALGLALAVPAGIFGLGPTLDSATVAPVDAPPAPAITASSPPSNPPAAAPVEQPLPSILSGAPAGAEPVAIATPSAPQDPPDSPPAGSPVAGVVGSTPIPGPGEVRAVGAAADAVAVAVDRGSDAPASVVVVDGAGQIAATIDLVIDGVAHHGARGVGTVDGGVVVSTASPAAVLEVDPTAGTVAVLTVLPDLPTCVPLAREDACQAGVVDTEPAPGHLAVDRAGTIYVVDREQSCVFRILGGEAVPWLCDIAYAPSPVTPGSGLRGIAATGERVVVTARLGLDGKGVVDEIAIEDGSPGPVRRLAELAPDDGVDGVDVLHGDGVVAALSGAGALLFVPVDGSDGARRVDGFERPVDLAARDEDAIVIERTGGAAGSLRATALD